MEYNIRAESAWQLVTRLSKRPGLVGLDECLLGSAGPLPHDVIEIVGEASTGKTMLAMQWIARCILSPPRGGLGVEVILIDTDHHQPLMTLVQLLSARMKTFLAQGPSSSHLRLSSSLVQSSVEDALKRLTIINVYDSTSLYTALLALDKMIVSKPRVSLVVVDSLPAFYWADRLCGGLQHMDSYLKRLLSTLLKSTKDQKVTTVFTRPSYFQSAAPSHFKSKDRCGESTILIYLSRDENTHEIDGTEPAGQSGPANIGNLFFANVRSAHGQNLVKYFITKDGIGWHNGQQT